MAYRRRRRTAGLHDAGSFPDAPYPICIWDYPRPWLIIPTRELVALALLTRLVGGADAQVRGHVAANLHVGNDRRPRPSVRFDMTTPANQRKLDIVEDLARLAEQSGISLIEMAIAFVIHHPGVTTSAIVGPRTMEQLESYLPAAELTLSTEVLDRIDQIVAPGVTVNPDDNSYGDQELTPQARRR